MSLRKNTLKAYCNMHGGLFKFAHEQRRSKEEGVELYQCQEKDCEALRLKSTLSKENNWIKWKEE